MDTDHQEGRHLRRLNAPAARRAVAAGAALAAGAAFAQPVQQVVRPPIAHYWMDVATSEMSIPGMRTRGGMGSMAGALFGGGPSGAAGGFGAGSGRSLDLALTSRDKPQGPLANHATPPPSRFDAPLPLVPPQAAPRERAPTEGGPTEYEKPRARMLIYWGCGETVRSGQPRVIDTATMSPAEFGSALAGHSAPDRGAARGPGRSLWPNPTDRRTVRDDASLIGGHRVTGEGVPEIAFQIGTNQDFMAPLEIETGGAPGASTSVAWKAVPTARAYFAQAIASRDGAETIVWTSSETQETGFGLFDYLPNNLVDRWVGEKVLMPATATRCAIPAGIFDRVEGASLRMIAYGEELNLVHPPRPADPRVAWEQIWAARVRVKSTGMAMLGMSDRGQGAARGSGASQSRRDAAAEEPAGGAPADAQSQQAPASPAAPLGIPNVNPVDVLRGIFRR